MATERNESEGDQEDALAQVLGNAVAYVANEAVVLAQYELHLDAKFAKLWPSQEDAGDSFNKRMDSVVEHLGAPPEYYIVADGKNAPPGDNYPQAAMREAFSVFQRARKSVLRAHMFMTGSQLLANRPELMELPPDPGVATTFVNAAGDAFWEHAEAAYIRLFSYWDRLGQVLDFAFFNIRKFDQNGFHAVMDRVAANVAPMNQRLKDSSSWKRLRSFQTSEREDGLKWLLMRRNLLVHSVHLHPIDEGENGMLNSQFNHLAQAHRDKLRPQTPAREVELLVGQLQQAGELFSSFLTLVEFSPSRKVDTWVRD